MAIDSELASELSQIRPLNANPKDRVFAGILPRIERFRPDLKAAGIEPVDAAGKRVDFHAMRMTFQMFLTLNGESFRVAMECMRHRDPNLTTKAYTDAGLLPTREAINKWPLHLQADTLHDTPAFVPDVQSGAHAGTVAENGNELGRLINKGFQPNDAQRVTPMQNEEMVRGAGFEPATPTVSRKSFYSGNAVSCVK